VNPDQDLIKRVSQNLNALSTELNTIFPQRSGAIEQMILALVMRQHILIWGDTGTAKTALARAVFGSITGAQKYEANLSRFSSRQDVFGPVNTKIMTEEGRVRYWLDEGAVNCHFVFLDEFLDASDPLLRALLTLLNERLFLNGTERVQSLVHTAVATTNGDPWDKAKRNPDLKAVVDRFLFKCKVSYLDADQEILDMLTTYLTGLVPTTTLPLSDLLAFSDIVVSNNLVTDPILIQAYVEAMNAFKQATNMAISDRSLALYTQILEAHALWTYGRTTLIPEDILAVAHGVCDGEDVAGIETFKRAALPAIKKAEKQMGASIDNAQQALLAELEGQIPSLTVTSAKTMAEADLVNTIRKLTELHDKVTAVVPQTQTTTLQKNAIIKKMDRKIDIVKEYIFKKP